MWGVGTWQWVLGWVGGDGFATFHFLLCLLSNFLLPLHPLGVANKEIVNAQSGEKGRDIRQLTVDDMLKGSRTRKDAHKD